MGALRKPPESFVSLMGNVGELQKALNKGSDLACAMIGGACVENALMGLLEHFLVDCKESEALFNIKGVLESLSDCNKMALCLGLISNATYNNIRKIAEIRNAFAHSQTPIGFADKDITAICDGLTFTKSVKSPTNTPRAKYAVAVRAEWINILLTIKKTAQLKPVAIADKPDETKSK